MENSFASKVMIFLLFALIFSGNSALGQPGTNNTYKGQRLSLYGIKINRQKADNIVLTCNVVNTGREEVSFSKEKIVSNDLVVELDTVNLPETLLGLEQNIVSALVGTKIKLSPGGISKDIVLKVSRKGAVPPDAVQDGTEKTMEDKNEKIPQNNAPQPARDSINDAKFEGASNRCADLVFDTVYVVKMSKKKMVLGFTLRNNGNGTARLLGSTEVLEDNIAVNVYSTTGTKLSRSAQLAGGVFIKDKETNNGLLMPGQRLKGSLEVTTKFRNKFSPNLVFELDPFQTVFECDKTNNTRGLIVKQ